MTRTPFAGHNLPLNGSLVEEDLVYQNAFPSWSSAGLSQPVFMNFPPDGTNRLFILERRGVVSVIPNRSDVVAGDVETVLNIESRVDSSATEEGLLGLAFHPNFSQNRYFYLAYTAAPSRCSQFSRCMQIVRYEINSQNPSQGLIGSDYVVLEIERPGSIEHHNGGTIAFGGDGFLYISVGDQDIETLAQDTNSLRGKILRVNVNSGTEFNPGIPSGNPFGNAVYHYGLRNPWRFSFDRDNPNDLWIADVGQTDREEVNWVPGGTGGGLNFGWPQCEGTLSRTGSGCTASQRAPDLEYATGVGGRQAVIGGYVYRGPLASLNGHYIFADFSGDVLTWDRVTRNAQTGLGVFEERLSPVASIGSMAEDEAGEVYTWSYFSSQVISKFVGSGGGSGGSFPATLSATGLFSNVANLTPAAGMIEYDVESPLWSDNAEKLRWIALPGNEKITFHKDEPWEFPIGTAIVKHFELDQPGSAPRRLETRVMLRQTGQWIGLTYRWNSQGTNANLLFDGLQETISLAGGGSQTWNYPSPSDCLSCHSAPAGRALGVQTKQLNGVFDYGAVDDNQLHAWNCIDLFDTDIGPPEGYDHFVAVDDTSASVNRRARDYLAVNCSTCHQPGTGSTDMNLRSDVLLGDMNIVSVSPIRGTLGLPSPSIIDPGDPSNSIMSVRMESNVEAQRMAKGTLMEHVTATNVMANWINSTLYDSGSGTTTLDSDEDGIVDGDDNCPSFANGNQSNQDGDGLGDLCDPDQQADLTTTTSLPTQVENDAAVNLAANVANGGLVTAMPSQVRFFLSFDGSLSQNDLRIGECFTNTISGSGVDGCIEPATMPAVSEFPEGDAFWIACADTLDQVVEGNENNNCTSAAVSIPEPAQLVGQVAALLTLALVVGLRRRAGLKN